VFSCETLLSKNLTKGAGPQYMRGVHKRVLMKMYKRTQPRLSDSRTIPFERSGIFVKTTSHL